MADFIEDRIERWRKRTLVDGEECHIELFVDAVEELRRLRTDNARLSGVLETANQKRAEDQGLPVASVGICHRTLTEFNQHCQIAILKEQSKALPDNILIALLCDAVRISRESAIKTNKLQRLNDQIDRLQTKVTPVSAWHAWPTSWTAPISTAQAAALGQHFQRLQS